MSKKIAKRLFYYVLYFLIWMIYGAKAISRELGEKSHESLSHSNEVTNGINKKGALLNTLRQSPGALWLRAQEAMSGLKNQWYKLQYTSLFLLGSMNASGQICLTCQLLGDPGGVESTIDYGLTYSQYNNFTDIMSPNRGFQGNNGKGLEFNTSAHKGIGIAQLGLGWSKMAQTEDENNNYTMNRFHIELRPSLATHNERDPIDGIRPTFYVGPTLGGSVQFVEGKDKGKDLTKTTFTPSLGIIVGVNITLGEAVKLGVGVEWKKYFGKTADLFDGIKGGYYPDGHGTIIDSDGKQTIRITPGVVSATIAYVIE